jgi:hypothetical protein
MPGGVRTFSGGVRQPRSSPDTQHDVPGRSPRPPTTHRSATAFARLPWLVVAAPVLSAECLGWARTANYSSAAGDGETTVLRSEAGPPTRYYIRRRGDDRLEWTFQADEDAAERHVLFVARIEVLERYLLGLFGDDIREDLGLAELDLPWTARDLAPGLELSEMVGSYRTLSRAGVGPVAAAPDATLSLLTLFPPTSAC